MDNKDNGKTLLQRFWFLNQGIFIWAFISLFLSIILIVLVLLFSNFPRFYTWFRANLIAFISIILAGGFGFFRLIKHLTEINNKKLNEINNLLWPFLKPDDAKTETFIIPDFSSAEYPFDEQNDEARNIKWRQNVLDELTEILKKKDTLILHGRSGYGKSIILWQYLKFLGVQKENIYGSLNTSIQKISRDYTAFRYHLVNMSAEQTLLILDQIDELKEDELTDLLKEAKNYGINKILLCAKTDVLSMVFNAYHAVYDGDLSTLGLYCLKPDDALINQLKLRGSGEDSAYEPTDTTIMKRLHLQLSGGNLSLIEYQFVNRLYLNHVLGDMIADEKGRKNTDINNDPGLIMRLAAAYFEKKLQPLPCDQYIACLSFLRILSDNRLHSIENESDFITMCPAKILEYFANDLVREHLIVQIGDGKRYRVSHEWVGHMFREISRILLSGENIDALDTARSGFASYTGSFKVCFNNYRETKPVTLCVVLCVIITFCQNLLWFISLLSGYQKPVPSPSEIGLRFVASVTVYIGILYMGNFFRCCVNMKKGQRAAMYLLGFFAAILPLETFFVPGNPYFNYWGLFGFAVVNSSIGIFYLINSIRHEINSKKWLIKKGITFLSIGIGLIIVNLAVFFFAPPETNLFSLLYLIYSVFICFAIKNYIHFQSLAVQRLRIAMKLNPSGTK